MLNKLKSLKNRYEELSALLAQPETMNDQKRYRELAREHAQLSEIVAAYDRYTAIVQELADCRAMLSEQHDAEMRELIHAELAGLDDYTYLEPAFETDYQVYYPPSSTEVPYWTGSFHHTMVRDSLLYSEDVTANRYASYFQYDYGELIIENMRADNDLHITVIKDSFALPFTAFLSTAVHKIDMIDLREFDGSVTEHLLSTSPDLVIMLYGNGSFSDVMYQFWD